MPINNNNNSPDNLIPDDANNMLVTKNHIWNEVWDILEIGDESLTLDKRLQFFLQNSTISPEDKKNMLLKGFENTPELAIELRNELETFRLFLNSDLNDQDKLDILMKSIEICDEHMEYDYRENSKVDYFPNSDFIECLFQINLSQEFRRRTFTMLCKNWHSYSNICTHPESILIESRYGGCFEDFVDCSSMSSDLLCLALENDQNERFELTEEKIIYLLNSDFLSLEWKEKIFQSIQKLFNKKYILQLITQELIDDISEESRKIIYDLYFTDNEMKFNYNFLSILEELDAPDEYKREKFMNSLETINTINTRRRPDPSKPETVPHSYEEVITHFQLNTERDIDKLKQISFLSEEDKEELLKKYSKKSK